MYSLLLFLPRERTIAVGAWGVRRFAAGSWVYTGRARRNLAARLARHAARCADGAKRCRWHVDYLREHAVLRRAWCFALAPEEECRVAAAWRIHPAAREAPARFGASDCRCAGHLVYLGEGEEVEPPGALRRLAAGGLSLRLSVGGP
ncbi:MAG: DUF123 domain-containing protein [Thermaerobacter sp.]|nr:DUF123 domain-containing protein [Thermaerobacter sp.]